MMNRGFFLKNTVFVLLNEFSKIRFFLNNLIYTIYQKPIHPSIKRSVFDHRAASIPFQRSDSYPHKRVLIVCAFFGLFLVKQN